MHPVSQHWPNRAENFGGTGEENMKGLSKLKVAMLIYLGCPLVMNLGWYLFVNCSASSLKTIWFYCVTVLTANRSSSWLIPILPDHLPRIHCCDYCLQQMGDAYVQDPLLFGMVSFRTWTKPLWYTCNKYIPCLRIKTMHLRSVIWNQVPSHTISVTRPSSSSGLGSVRMLLGSVPPIRSFRPRAEVRVGGLCGWGKGQSLMSWNHLRPQWHVCVILSVQWCESKLFEDRFIHK